jgi:hypothetical protein
MSLLQYECHSNYAAFSVDPKLRKKIEKHNLWPTHLTAQLKALSDFPVFLSNILQLSHPCPCAQWLFEISHPPGRACCGLHSFPVAAVTTTNLVS